MEWTLLEWMTLLAAALAVLLALWAARFAGAARRTTAELREKLRELEQSLEAFRAAEAYSAQLVPSIERSFGPAGRAQLRLRIENIGRGSARRVRGWIDGQALTPSGESGDESLDIDEIAPGTAISRPIPFELSPAGDHVKVELNWIDAAGRQQTSRALLGGG